MSGACVCLPICLSVLSASDVSLLSFSDLCIFSHVEQSSPYCYLQLCSADSVTIFTSVESSNVRIGKIIHITNKTLLYLEQHNCVHSYMDTEKRTIKEENIYPVSHSHWVHRSQMKVSDKFNVFL